MKQIKMTHSFCLELEKKSILKFRVYFTVEIVRYV